MKNSDFFYQNHQWIAGFRLWLVSRLLRTKIFPGIYRTLTGHQIKNIFCSVLFIFYALQLSFYVYWAKMILNLFCFITDKALDAVFYGFFTTSV